MLAKIKSKKTVTYGRVEVRAKIPKGDWIWPGIWMYQKENTYGGWPVSGEIDMMESRGNIKAESGGENHGVNEVTSTLHGTGDLIRDRIALCGPIPEKSALTASQCLLSVNSFWEYGNFSGPNVWQASEGNAPFDHPFFLILNVAAVVPMVISRITGSTIHRSPGTTRRRHKIRIFGPNTTIGCQRGSMMT